MPQRLTSTPLARRLCSRLHTSGLNLVTSLRNVAIRRLYPGYRQRAQGAWSWSLANLDGRDLPLHRVRSQDRPRDCLRVPHLGSEIGNSGIRPYPQNEPFTQGIPKP